MPAHSPAPSTLLLVISVAGLLAACGRSEPSVATGDEGQTMIRNGDSEVTVAREGESLNAGDGLPAFAPAYPGATVKTRVADIKGDGARGGMWVMESADPVDKIATFYDEQAKKAGVKPGMFVNEADSAVRIFGSADGKNKSEGVLIAISRDTDEELTKIVITAGTAMPKADRPAIANEPHRYPASPQRLQ